MRELFLSVIICLITSVSVYAQHTLKGKVFSEGEALEFANIYVVELEKGIATDMNGEFELMFIEKGSYTLKCSYLGYFPKEITIKIPDEKYVEISLEKAFSSLDEVVVSGTRSERFKKDLAVGVDVIGEKLFQNTQAMCLADGLNYQSGLRIETDCQTCNYTQVRMNGLGGAYSQILFNSRPIFSALNGLYGLEQIPANMIKQVEVVKGGGSALYGTSAIAGTINIITKEPAVNGYEFGIQQSLIDGVESDLGLNLNTTQVSKNGKTGLTVFASNRNRAAYDVNGDGFSEMPKIKNTSFGLQSFAKLTPRSKIQASLNVINEERNGGDQLDEAPHKRDQSEMRDTQILSGTLDYDLNLNEASKVSIYFGAQQTDRSHYTGVGGQDGYGTTDNYTIQSGFHINKNWVDGKGTQDWTLGAEFQQDDVYDEIPAYNYLTDQLSRQFGVFAQRELALTSWFTVLAGIRLSWHNQMDEVALTPRTSLLFKPNSQWRFRTAYGRGFRAPQAFDADMHIAFSGGGISRIEIDPDLKPEYSDSYTISADYDKATEHYIYGFSFSVFATKLYDAFVLEEKRTTAEGNMILGRVNGGNSLVQGISAELRANLDNKIDWNAGITYQKSEYDRVIEWSADILGTKKYTRTPDWYGFFTLTSNLSANTALNVSGVYTGSMLVPHVAGAPGVNQDELYKSDAFWEIGLKLNHDVQIPALTEGLSLELGVQNVFNAYQSNFDVGPNRDSNFIYGPSRPRIFYAGLKFKI